MEISLLIANCISLFSLINPLGAIPVFLSLTANQDAKWVKGQIKQTCINILIICLCSYWLGTYILQFFGISISALRIAGGIVIARSGFLLLNAQHKKDVSKQMELESSTKEDISFTPLAMPLLAGPGSISFLINLSLQHTAYSDNAFVVAAIVIVSVAIYFIFSLAPRIQQYLGEAGLKALSKIMGFLVLAIGVQSISSAILVLLNIK